MARQTKKQARKRPAPGKLRPARAAGPPIHQRAVEIVFSYDEIDFLRKITKREFEPAASTDRGARLSLRDKLLDVNFSRTAGGSGLIVVGLTRPELALLQRITREVYSFITAEERRARLILREKILIAAEKAFGKKLRREQT